MPATRTVRPILILTLLLAFSSPVPAAERMVIRQTDATGKTRYEVQPPGRRVERLTLDGRVLRTRSTDPNEPLRLIVEFDTEPAVRAKQLRLDAALPARRVDQLRADLARLSTSAGLTGTVSGAVITHEYTQVFSGAAVTLPAALYSRLKALPYVRGVFPDDTVYASLAQSVPLIGADRVQNSLGGTGAGVRVAILDTGIDFTHPAFGGGYGAGQRVAGGWDFVHNFQEPRDDHGHGTHVAGIIAGNGGGVIGVAPAATLYAYKVLTAGGFGFESWILSALDMVLDPNGNGLDDDACRVVNMSFGTLEGGPDDPLSVAVDHLCEAGVVCVVAAGNVPASFSIGAPASSRLAITVGASTKADQIASYSSRGPANGSYELKPDLVAPGSDIQSAWPGGGKMILSGTSMAAPHVAGVAAQLLQLHPDWTGADVKAVLVGTAKDLGEMPLVQGSGRVDAWAAANAQYEVTPSSISFGRTGASSGTWTTTRTLHVRSLGLAVSVDLLTPDLSLTDGATVTVRPSHIDVPPGGTVDVTATLAVNDRVTRFPEISPFVYSGTLRATSARQSCRVPVSFHRNLELRVDSPAPIDWLVVHDRRFGGFLSGRTSTDAPVLLPPGNYDVLASFWPTFRFVARERVPITADATLSIDPAEATLKVDFANVGPDGAPVDCDRGDLSLYHEAVKLAFNYSGYPLTEIWTSPLGPDYRLEWSRVGKLPSGARVRFAGAASGLTRSATVTNAPGDLRHLVTFFPAPSGSRAARLVWEYLPIRINPDHFGFGYFDADGAGITGPSSFEEWVQLSPYEDHVQTGERIDLFEDTGGFPNVYNPYLTGPMLRYDRGWPLEGHASSPEDAGTFRFAGEQLRLFTGAPVWRGQFANSMIQMGLIGDIGVGVHPWVDQYGARQAGPDPAFTLTGSGVPRIDDSIPGGGGFVPDNWYGHPVAAGAYDFHSELPFRVKGLPALASVNARFDTRLVDPNPPALRTLQFFSDGVAVDSIAFESARDAGMRYRLLGDDSLCATAAWMHDGFTTTWTPLAVERIGDEFRVRFPPTTDGEISVKLEARDAAGNVMQQVWEPAFVASPGAMPAVTALGATSEAGAARLSWGVAAPAGRSLDVERREDAGEWSAIGSVRVGADGTATYLDTGVLAGHTYGYRLTAFLGGLSQHSVEQSISVAAQVELALAGVRPNPSHGRDLVVDLALPSAAPARLALYDIAGREVAGSEVGAFGAGRHLLRMTLEESPRPGVYFLRLTQGSRSLTSRVCLLR